MPDAGHAAPHGVWAGYPAHCRVPVYSGRVPAVALERLAAFSGSGTPALALVSFGNRDYEDALLELVNWLGARGFNVIGAGAFPARHSIFPSVAADRPDARDVEEIRNFAAKCADKLEALRSGKRFVPLQVKGDFPYKEVKPSQLKPVADDSCVLCGACVEACPTRALALGEVLRKNADLCIACAACVFVCPERSQAFPQPMYDTAAAMLLPRMASRKEPEGFV